MKNILFVICLFISTAIGAQNNILTEIEKANAAYKTVEGTFTRTQTNKAKGTTETDKGILYLSGEDQMAQHYQAPSADVLIINGDANGPVQPKIPQCVRDNEREKRLRQPNGASER